MTVLNVPFLPVELTFYNNTKGLSKQSGQLFNVLHALDERNVLQVMEDMGLPTSKRVVILGKHPSSISDRVNLEVPLNPAVPQGRYHY